MISYSIYTFYHKTQNNHCVRKAFSDQSSLRCGGLFQKGHCFHFPSFANIAPAFSFCRKKEAEKKQIDRLFSLPEKKCIDICECLSLRAFGPLFQAELNVTFFNQKTLKASPSILLFGY